MRLRRDLAVAGDERAREIAEEKERRRWLDELSEIIKEAGLPLAVLAERSPNAEAILRRCAQGRRATTLRKRVRDWRKARSYFLRALGTPWPADAADVLEYIEARASEPCHKTTLQSFHLALAFVERAGGIRASEGLAGDPIVVGALEEVTLAVTGGRVKPRRPALREPVIFTVVREMMVVDDSAEFYDRIYCWWLLVKTWASLRFDDHRGLIPGDLMLTSHGLSGVLSRTKTSGAGKATETLPVYVSSEAYVFQASWLSVGYFLWEQVPGKRDYFLVMPSADRSGTTAAEVRYPDAVAISRAILRGSPSIVWQEGRPSWGSGPLLEPTSVALWTEHSARASVPSWADCLATFPKDWLDHLGRWGGDGSAGYVRTYRSRVRKIQESVARALRECRGGTDFLDEEEIFEHMARFLRAGDLDEETIEKAKVRLRYFETISVNETADQIEDRKNEDISEVLALEAGDGESAGSAGDAAAAASSGGSASTDGSVVSVASVPYVGRAVTEEKTDVVEPAPLQGYYVSIRPGSGFRRLHLLGACGRRPGTDYARFLYMGPRCPPSEDYHDWCKQCWKDGAPITEYDGEEESWSSSSSSSEREAVVTSYGTTAG